MFEEPNAPLSARRATRTRADSETVEDLIRDFCTRLGAIAGEFNARADRIGSSGRTADSTAPARPVDLVRRAQDILAERRARRRYFPTDLFHEPAWEMLMTLFIIGDTEHSMNVKTLAACSDAPATTSQRWIDHLHKFGLIDRAIDIVDRRRIDIALSDRGRDAMIGYLLDVGSHG